MVAVFQNIFAESYFKIWTMKLAKMTGKYFKRAVYRKAKVCVT